MKTRENIDVSVNTSTCIYYKLCSKCNTNTYDKCKSVRSGISNIKNDCYTKERTYE